MARRRNFLVKFQPGWENIQTGQRGHIISYPGRVISKLVQEDLLDKSENIFYPWSEEGLELKYYPEENLIYAWVKVNEREFDEMVENLTVLSHNDWEEGDVLFSEDVVKSLGLDPGYDYEMRIFNVVATHI